MVARESKDQFAGHEATQVFEISVAALRAQAVCALIRTMIFRTPYSPIILLCALCFACAVPVSSQTTDVMAPGKVETIVCIRHGEKPLLGLGQLTCQGLNRALKLPSVLIGKFGKPNFIFAPDPNQMNYDPAGEFCYVRPLATIEPTAIQCSLPVNTHFGFKDIAGLEQELGKPVYASATIFVAWEHKYLDEFVKDMIKAAGGDPSQVPGWPGNDFDSIFVIRLAHNKGGKGGTTATFTRDTEGLNNLSTDCQ